MAQAVHRCERYDAGRTHGDKLRFLYTVKPGSIVGWSAALGSRRYTSSAVCPICTRLLRVRGDDLRRLCLQHPDTGEIFLDRLATIIAERLHSTHDMVFSLLQLGLTTTVEKNGG